MINGELTKIQQVSQQLFRCGISLLYLALKRLLLRYFPMHSILILWPLFEQSEIICYYLFNCFPGI